MKKLLLVITTFFLTILGTSPALAADQDVSFSTANARNIPKKINGINQNWFVTTPIQYNFNREAFNQLNTNLIRFPGGVIGNFYDWRTFAPDWKAASRLFADEPGRAEAIKRVFDSYVKTLDPITFITTVKNLRKNVIMIVNIYSNTPDEIAAGLTKLKDAGIVVNYIELGNEMYRHTDIATYLRKAKATAGKVRGLFPGAQIGIVGDRDDWTGNPDFDWQVPNADWFDAVIYHPFSGSGKRLNDEKQKKHILFDIPEKISNLVNKTREQYPGKKIWFTEWNIWEPANDGYFMTETYSYAVYHYNFLLNILKYPSITIANVHNLWHTSKQFSLLYPKQAIIDQYYNNGVNPPNNTYSFDQFFVKSPSYWPTLWIGQAFAAYNKFTIVDNSNIIAAYFFDSKQPGKGSIAIINRTGQSQKITFRGIDNISRTASILAKDWLEPSSEANEMRPETRTMTTNTLALAPYAIAYLSSRGGSLPTPTPTATPPPPSPRASPSPSVNPNQAHFRIKKFNDKNANKTQDAGELGLRWRFKYRTKANATAVWGSWQTDYYTATTSAGLGPKITVKKGSLVQVTEYPKTGWVATMGVTKTTAALTDPAKVYTIGFGNKRICPAGKACFRILKFNDKNGNGKRDANEASTGKAWTFRYKIGDGNWQEVETASKSGLSKLIAVAKGSQVTAQELTSRKNWQPTTPKTKTKTLTDAKTYWLGFGNKWIPPSPSPSASPDKAHFRIKKFNDKNANKTQDAGELGLRWRFKYRTKANATAVWGSWQTDYYTATTSAGLGPKITVKKGSLVQVTEYPKTGWVATMGVTKTTAALTDPAKVYTIGFGNKRI